MACNDKNPLIREGTSLLDRVLEALSVDYSKADERDIADILLFAKRYAAYLNYYNEDNVADGDWQPLMMMDISVTLASLSKMDVRKLSDYKKLLFKRIGLAADEASAKNQFRFLFDLLFSLVQTIDEQYRLIPPEMEYKAIIREIISGKMQRAFANINFVFENIVLPDLIDTTADDLDADAPMPVLSCNHFNKANLSPEWLNGTADIHITVPSAFSVEEKIVYVVNHNIFKDQLDSLLNGAAAIVTRSGQLLNETLDNFPDHTPHYALFIAFLKLLRVAQDDLNQYTQKHLDFYYKEVLQLQNKTPEPDVVHLTFELQKPVLQHLMSKNTLFNGGKDSTGKEIQYALNADVVLNKATVSKIHSQQIKHNGKDLLIASPVADSEDGQGAKLISPDKSWFTFGDIQKAKNANTGFAIASNILYLNEGTRTVTITVNSITSVADLFNSGFNLNCFTAQTTGPKDWQTVKGLTLSAGANNQQMVFRFTIAADQPAVVPYSESIHKEGLATNLPVLKIYLNQDLSDAIPYTLLCKKELQSIDVTVNVAHIKDLAISHDKGSIDPSAPFTPFGDFPDAGTSLYIGSKELFQKQLTSLTLNFNWKNVHPGNTVDVQSLYGGNWISISNANIYPDAQINPGGSYQPAAIEFTRNESFSNTASNGFVRLVLQNDLYSYSQFLSEVKAALSSTKLIPVSGTDPVQYTVDVTPPPQPNSPYVYDLTADYEATQSILFDATVPADNNILLHLTPFGYYPVNNRFVDAGSDTEPTKKITLVQDVIHDGELFVGFAQAMPSTVLQVLFQVADGSSNPLKDVETVYWYYLAANNNWKQFKKEWVIDGTGNFTQSGIITLSLPAEVSDQNSALEQGLIWIKAAVVQNTDAVCKMVLIQAQAAEVTLVQDDAKQIEFRQILPAGTISKTVAGDAALKTISQPFDSEGGRIRESDEQFYVRVSERLRHKQRAITIWDYEHIILERFHEIFKVKCVNHSGFYKGQGEDVFCENYPGHVTVVTITDLKNKTNINPLRPYTPVRLLKNINDYLVTIISPFVKLHVKNPQFEEIQLDFKVQFTEFSDETFSLQLLNMEIEQFLCPWAYKDSAPISFGGKVVKSVLLNFVEERPYVDFVTCFKMNQIIKRKDDLIIEAKMDVEEAVASTAMSILVSYYDEKTGTRHKIVSPASCNC